MDTRQLDDRSAPISGIWLPLVTPFREGRLDERSLVRLLRHYLGQPGRGALARAPGRGPPRPYRFGGMAPPLPGKSLIPDPPTEVERRP